ncbi:response regulator transcription factor [Halalkalibacter flavus]|uniref:response regulator transcription factor n=1 Tax=Halalkalibacter flavus TaxID=3090668 RepID=UPI002FCAD6E1
MNSRLETAPKVALVEDEPSHALLICYNLESRGKEVSLFESGDQFLHAELYPFDLIIINVDLHDIDGVKLCEQLKKKGVTAPILFATTNPKIEEGCCQGPQVKYIIKPFSIKDMVHKVDQLLTKQFAVL